MDHFRIIKRAAEITWKYRALWLIGLLLVLAGGGAMSGLNVNSPPSAPGSRGGDNGGEIPWEGRGDLPHVTVDDGAVWAIVAIVVAVVLLTFAFSLALGVLATVVRYVTRTSLIKTVHWYEETGDEIGFWPALHQGWSRAALRLFLVNLVVRVPLALLFLLVIGPIVALAVGAFAIGFGPGIFFGVLLLLLLIPIFFVSVVVHILLTPFMELVARACVIEDLGIWESIQRGFSVVRRNVVPAGLQWLLMVGIGIAWNIVMVPVNIVLLIIALVIGGLPALAIGGLAGLAFGWVGGLIAGMLVFLPLFFVLIGVPNIALTTLITVFHSAAWTLTYRELLAIDEDGADEDEALASAEVEVDWSEGDPDWIDVPPDEFDLVDEDESEPEETETDSDETEVDPDEGEADQA